MSRRVTVIPAHEVVKEYDCKTPNCVGTTRRTRGIYAFLCDDCIERRPPRKPAERFAAPGDGFEAKAKELVALGRDLDRAVAGYRPAKVALEDAMAVWREAVDRLAA